jgi:hypothetical protein
MCYVLEENEEIILLQYGVLNNLKNNKYNSLYSSRGCTAVSTAVRGILITPYCERRENVSALLMPFLKATTIVT